MREDESDKNYERERQWNKPNGRSPSQSKIPGSTRRVSQGSPSQNATIRPDVASPSRNVSRRASLASMRSFEDGRSSLGSSVSSSADCMYTVHCMALWPLLTFWGIKDRERMSDMDDELIKERERRWNKPQPRRVSSNQSFHSPNERTRTSSTPERPNIRPSSWHSAPIPIPGSRPDSPALSVGSTEKEHRNSSQNPVEHERERNWNSPQPKWEYQAPRSLSPLPPSPAVPGSGYGKPPPDWDPQRLESPSRSRHSSLTNVRRASFNRSRTSSLSDEHAPLTSQRPLGRAGTDPQLSRPYSPAFSDTHEDDGRSREAGSRFGWTFPKKRSNLPPFEPDVESPQKRPFTPPGSRPSSRLSSRPSLIPIRSPGRKNEEPAQSSSTHPRVKEKEPERTDGARTSTIASLDFGHAAITRPRIEPIDLIHDTTAQDLVPTDIESGTRLFLLAMYSI
jgi:serine/arginine repetitive matrix protein 2